MNPFETESALAVGAGLAILGVGFVIIDFFVVRLVSRMHSSEPSMSEEDSLVSLLSPRDKRQDRRARSLRSAISAHRLRLGGIIVSAAGLLVLAMAALARLNGN